MLGAVSLCVGGAGGLLVVPKGPPGAPGVAAETDQHWVRPPDGRGGDGVCERCVHLLLPQLQRTR